MNVWLLFLGIQSHDYQLILDITSNHSWQRAAQRKDLISDNISDTFCATYLLRNFDSPFSLHHSCFVLFARQVARNMVLNITPRFYGNKTQI